MLKSKKHNTQKDWLLAWEAQKRFSNTEQGKLRAEHLIELAISRIPRGKCVYTWSGGKDAIALQCICERAGITDCALGTIGFRWEYPSFVKYVNENKPDNLVIKDYGITADFLNSNEHLLFPDNYKDVYYWMIHCNQRTFNEFLKETSADFVLCGHRRQDGNIVKDGIIKQKVFPMYDFTHEDVFLIIGYCGKQLPEIYFYKDGFQNGTHTWLEREGGHVGMSELLQIDKNILLENRNLNKINRFLKARNL